MGARRIVTIVGTRPEAIKMAPVHLALQAAPDMASCLLATAQHREMLDQVLGAFGIVPDVDLDLMRPGQDIAQLTARLIPAVGDALDRLRADAVGISVSDSLTRLTIQKVYETYGVLLEPHGAVSWAALDRYLSLREEEPLCIATETAHPGKFPEALREIGVEPDLPESMKDLEKKESSFFELSGEYDAFKDFLLGI